MLTAKEIEEARSLVRAATDLRHPGYGRACLALETLCAATRQPEQQPSAESVARFFHETYERLAPAHGYETRRESAKPWERVPEPNKSLMVAVAGEVIERFRLSSRQDSLVGKRVRSGLIAGSPKGTITHGPLYVIKFDGGGPGSGFHYDRDDFEVLEGDDD